MLILLSTALVLAVAVLIARALRQSKALRNLRPDAEAGSAALPPVAVLVPARDEADNIADCLGGILRQEGRFARFRVVAVDDHSTDATPRIIERLAAADARLRKVSAGPLPSDWLGKPHACWAGYSAGGTSSDWLCFIDADVRVEPELLATAVSAAEREGLDLLSLAPRQMLGSFAERLIMPIGFYLLGFRQNLKKLQDPASDEATAAGLFILVRRSAYQAVGGHAAVRASVCEDVALACRVKAAGGKVAMWGGDELLSTRMYHGWASLWEGVGKNLVDMLGGPASTLATVVVANLIVWGSLALPVADLLEYLRAPGPGTLIALALVLAAFGAVLGFHVAGARHFRVPAWYGLLYPIAYAIGSVLALDSVRRRLAGEVSWKGRTYRLSEPTSLGK